MMRSMGMPGPRSLVKREPAVPAVSHYVPPGHRGRGLHSFPSQLNLSASVYRIIQLNS
jgi:hypothetical protein